MQFRLLGRTGLQVSLVSLGTGGPSQFGQHAGAGAEDQRALIRQALDMGINFFDTSTQYSNSEELLGRALEGVPRESYILATKCAPFDRASESKVLPPSEIERQAERSLRRLQTDVIDLYQIHGVTPQRYDEIVESIYPVLARLQQAGKVRFIGITELFFSDPSHEMLRRAVPSGLWDSVMLKYGILNQAAAHEVLPLCQQHNVGVLNMAPVRVKLTRPAELRELLDEWTARDLIPEGALPGDDPLGWLVQGSTESAIAAGYKFAAEPEAISTVLTGTANPAHLASNAAAILGEPLPEEHTRRLKELFGHLAEGA
ncbi:MAG TPA: aldo/keto reductase [Dehalococcoidia bacterium]|nr:aldo/keto reductase [Dehalococcoidia bacterium]